MAAPTGIPDVPHGVPAGMSLFLSRVKEVLDVLTGRVGRTNSLPPRSQAVTYQDLIDMGLIDEDYEKV